MVIHTIHMVSCCHAMLAWPQGAIWGPKTLWHAGEGDWTINSVIIGEPTLSSEPQVLPYRASWQCCWSQEDIFLQLNTWPSNKVKLKYPRRVFQSLLKGVCGYVFWAPEQAGSRFFITEENIMPGTLFNMSTFHCFAPGHLERIRDKCWHWKADLTLLFLWAEFFFPFSPWRCLRVENCIPSPLFH